MKIAVQTGGILDHFGIDEGFRIIKEAGFDAVDFNIDHCLSGYNIKNNIFIVENIKKQWKNRKILVLVDFVYRF